MTDLATCSAPGCSELGTHKCSSCKITPYCSVACQTIDWLHHKEECHGRLRKIGEAHLLKAEGFDRELNWPQSLRFSESALTCLKKLNARPLEVIMVIDDAMRIKFNALNFLGQHAESLECAKERYGLWAAGYMRHYGMLRAAFPLIESLIHNGEHEQAALIARTAYEMVINDVDNIIPEGKRQEFLAHGSRLLAEATYRLARSGGIPPDETQKAGEEAISLARKALEIDIQLHGAEGSEAANDMGTLANVLSCFNGVDDDEILRLHEQGIANCSRVQGRLSPNVAINELNLGHAYDRRGMKAFSSNNLDRCVTNLESALPHYREAERIYRAINQLGPADKAAQCACDVEKNLCRIATTRAAITRG